MGYTFAEIAFTDTVKKVQQAAGSRATYARVEAGGNRDFNGFTDAEAAFIAARDSFYMASVSETGWPYVQHRGGPAGFVKVLDERTLGFADYRGNRQYVSVGNLMTDDRVSVFFMDYGNRSRLKLLGRVSIIAPDDAETMEKLKLPGHAAPVERGFLITLEAFDWNCPQYITPRYTMPEIERTVAPLKQRIAELEAMLDKAPAT